jgi:hypothetical protein
LAFLTLCALALPLVTRGLCRSATFLALGRGLFFAALLALGLLAFVGVLGCSTLWSLTGGLLLLTLALRTLGSAPALHIDNLVALAWL